MLMAAMEEFYRSLGMLASFQHLNREACRKIVKKHDKVMKVRHFGLIILTLHVHWEVVWCGVV